MALRLRRDVQKSSYYVWFLGADEARGLRGPRVINSVLPYIIDRAKEIDPIKVTLQVSHKGIKIVQGSTKNFIPHSAITSSIQVGDIVACVLLIYNPATKCPLHINAYRCDSDVTAEALNKQLQTLINRPENQKRFEELENRLGVGQLPPLNMDAKNIPRRQETSPKRFASSLGSDTGNSTRDSECSEEHSPVSLSPPSVKPKGSIFDSLAAELRAKLNGNGPPLLLPPRDYDTVHRSKGNLAAIELRRCRNSMIVGDMNTINSKQNENLMSTKQVSSRGSSGIGSDLAPSPERQDVHSSSDENWSNEADNSIIKLKPKQIAVEKKPLFSKSGPRTKPEDSYLRDLPSKPFKPIKETPSPWSKEEEIRPIIMHPSDYDDKFKRIMMDEEHLNKRKSYALLDDDKKLERFEERARFDEIRDRFDDRGRFEDRYNDRYKFEERPRERQRFEPDHVRPKFDDDRKFIDRPRIETSHKYDDDRKFEERPRFDHKYDDDPRFDRKYDDDRKFDDRPRFETSHKYDDRPKFDDDRKFDDRQRKSDFSKKMHDLDINRNSLKRRDESKGSLERGRPEDRGRPYSERSLERGRPPKPHYDPEQGSMDRGRKYEQRMIKPYDDEKPYHQSSLERGRKYEQRMVKPYIEPEEKPFHQNSMERGRKYEQRIPSKSCSRERNPYTEEESLPYIESMKKMMKSPIMKFKSFDGEAQQEMFQRASNRKPQKSEVQDRKDYNHRQRNVSESSNVDSSPPRHAKLSAKSSRDTTHSYDQPPRTRYNDWSEEEEVQMRSREYRDQRDNHRDSRDFRRSRDVGLEDVTDYRKEREYNRRENGFPPLNNAKSLSNLTKGGYRHSYAEPLMRSGRVGLAAVHPF